MKETWLPVPKYEGLYEVSSFGRVKSLARIHKTRGQYTTKEFIRKQVPNTHGYYMVTLSKNGVHKGFLVSRLVAMAFLPNPDNKRTVNHINMDPKDNRVENLEWATHSEQGYHAHKNNPNRKPISFKGTLNGNSKYTEDQIRLAKTLLSKNYSQQHVSSITGVNKYTIWRIVHKNYWSHVKIEQSNTLDQLQQTA